jgi:hypothetical protein
MLRAVLITIACGLAAESLSFAASPLPDSVLAGPPAHTLLPRGETTIVPIDLAMGQPVVEVYLNGKGPYRMFLDTCAGSTVLDQGLTTELGLAKRGETHLGDPVNPQAIRADVVTIDSLRIGSAVFTGVSAASFDRSAIRLGEGMPRGVVGFPVFRELVETIDFPKAELRLSHDHLSDANATGRYRTEHSLPLVPIQVAGVAMEAHLDTGSPGFLSIPERDSARVRFAGPLQVLAHGRTVNSEVTFRGATLDGAVQVAGVTFDRPIVMLNDKLPQANLGSGALRDCVVTIDPANQRLRIERTRQSAEPVADSLHAVRRVVVGPAPGEKRAGVMLSPQPDGSLLVVDTIPGSAASQSDIKAGDIVLELNGDSVAKLGQEENLARLHHSPVTLTIKRGETISHVTLTF